MGSWEPIVSMEHFQRGLDILHKNDNQKSRHKKHLYLLNGLLWMKVDDKCFKLYSSAPSGRSRSYPYYGTQVKFNGKAVYISCNIVGDQILACLQGIAVEPALIPAIRSLYEKDVKQVTTSDRDTKVSGLHRQLSQLKEEETRLGRLFITEKISEAVYNQLRTEWQEKLRNIELTLAELERDTRVHLDDLDAALVLLTKATGLYPRLDEKKRSTLLQILVKQIIVDSTGEIIDYELNSPFVYLRSLVDNLSTPAKGKVVRNISAKGHCHY